MQEDLQKDIENMFKEILEEVLNANDVNDLPDELEF